MKHTNNNENLEPTQDLLDGVMLIYVASLADYNAGRLLGDWIEVSSNADDIRERITKVLKTSTEPFAEEWAIHDYSGFSPLRLSEWHDLENIAAIVAGVEQHGEIFLHVLDHLGDGHDIDEAHRYLNEQYRGECDCLTSWVEDFMNETSGDAINALPAVIRSCIDWERVARDFELSGDVFTLEVGGSVHVFWS